MFFINAAQWAEPVPLLGAFKGKKLLLLVIHKAFSSPSTVTFETSLCLHAVLKCVIDFFPLSLRLIMFHSDVNNIWLL